MAHGTVSRELCLCVIGIVGRVVILHVAIPARTAGQVVVVIHVTLAALQVCVSERQWETNGVVIKVGGLPGAGRVTHLTGLRKIERDVTGIVGLLEIG
jgi:hypothetical protein